MVTIMHGTPSGAELIKHTMSFTCIIFLAMRVCIGVSYQE